MTDFYMIYKRVDKYLKENKYWIKNIFFSIWFDLVPSGLRGGRDDVEDDEVEWDIIYDWLEEAVPV